MITEHGTFVTEKAKFRVYYIVYVPEKAKLLF